jgi:antitoxin PrlF
MATITSKGQVTIPKEIRDLLGVHPGDAVDFAIQNGQVVVQSRLKPSALKGILKGRAKRPLTIEQMRDAVKTRAAELDARSRK